MDKNSILMFDINSEYKLKEYCNKEEALNKLFFEICPKNTDIKDILLKASTLNDFFETSSI